VVYRDPDEVARDARRAARTERRDNSGATSTAAAPRRREVRLAQAPATRVATIAGILAVGAGVAAALGAQNAQAWLVGLVVSVVSLALAAVLRPSPRDGRRARRRRAPGPAKGVRS
jgi:hypothetical protein